MLFIIGLQWVPAGSSSVLMATMPMFVALYTALIRRERLGRYIWLGVFLSFVGIFVICIIVNKINQAFTSMDTRRLVALKE